MPNKIKRIVVHCSDSKIGDVEMIRNWHVNDNGWRDIGYSIVILNGHRKKSNVHSRDDDGLIEMGRGLNFDNVIDDDEQGAHAKGFNSDSIGICLVGVDKFTNKQFESLSYFVKLWQNIIPDIEVIGHCKISDKSCPNFDVKKFMKLINDEEKQDWSILR